MQERQKEGLSVFELEVWPEWFIYKSIRPALSVFLRAEDISATRAIVGLINQSTDVPYEVIVVTKGDPIVSFLEELESPIVRWCIGDAPGYYTARGRIICEFPAKYKPSPKMIDTFYILDKLEEFGIAYGKVEYRSGPKRSRKIFARKPEGGKELFLSEVVAYA